MGKDGRKSNVKRFPREESPLVEQPLTNRPFQGSLKNIKVGSTCLKCGEVVDSRPGWSLPYRKGIRGRLAQRQGYIHETCLQQIELERKTAGITRLEVPCLTEEDIVEVLSGLGVSQ